MVRYYAPTSGAEFLRSVTSTNQARSMGYAQHLSGGPLPYTLRWTDPKIVALGVNNRAMMAGLSDVQGYNPIHIARLDTFMRALNGQPQEYHQNDVFDTGLESPLLDLLGVRYIVMPVTPALDEVEPNLSRQYPIVYADADVKVLENDRALPRTWLVHDAVQMDSAQVLEQIVAGTVDPRHTVALEQAPPPLGEAASAPDQATLSSTPRSHSGRRRRGSSAMLSQRHRISGLARQRRRAPRLRRGRRFERWRCQRASTPRIPAPPAVAAAAITAPTLLLALVAAFVRPNPRCRETWRLIWAARQPDRLYLVVVGFSYSQRIIDPTEYLYGESIVLDETHRLAAGQPLYGPTTRLPLTVTAYPPVYYLLVGVLQQLSGDTSYSVGRIVSAAATLASILLIGWSVHRITAQWAAGLLAAGLFVTQNLTVLLWGRRTASTCWPHSR